MFPLLKTQLRCLSSITRKYLTHLHGPKRPYLKNNSPNYTFFLRDFHKSRSLNDKLFQDVENSHAFSHLPPLEPIQLTWTSSKEVDNIDELEGLLAKNWRQSNASAIVEAFERIKSVCIVHNIKLSDRRFDNLVDGLMDHCEKLTDEELLKLLRIINKLPQCENAVAHNYCDVWNCLDDICCWKMHSWDLNKKLNFAEAWFNLHLGRIADYTFEVVDGIRPRSLSKKFMLYLFFYLNVNRRNAITFDAQAALAKFIDEYTVDELAIIAMGYFKTKTKIKLAPILFRMIQKVSDDIYGVNEISLAAILKEIRLSQNFSLINEVLAMLDKLTDRISELSPLSLVHLGTVGCGLQIRHEPSLRGCTEKILQNITSVRVKDIERILLANAMFNEETDFYEAAFKEIHKKEREIEFIQYNRSLGCILNYLSMRKRYSYDLLDKVLNDQYINDIYGKTAKDVPRELFFLDCSVDVECPDYRGNRLSPTKRYKAAKWLTDWPPDNPSKKSLTTASKFFLDVYTNVKNTVGDEALMMVDHVLPHFNKSDIILCKDKKTGQFVVPQGFANYVLGDIKKPIDTGSYYWYSIVTLPETLIIRNKLEPIGGMIVKERHLKAIGYIPVFVSFTNEEDRVLCHRIKFCKKII